MMGIVEEPLLTVERWERGSECQSSQKRKDCRREGWEAKEGKEGRGLRSL